MAEGLQSHLRQAAECLPSLLREVAEKASHLLSIAIKYFISYLVPSINTNVEIDDQARTLRCVCHELEFGEEPENNKATCDNCLQQISGRIYRCNKCDFVLHKSCTELPLMIQHPSDPFPLYLHTWEDQEGEVRCNCCKSLLKGYFYGDSSSNSACSLRLDLACIFLPFKRRIKLHEHQLQLCLEFIDFRCDACGIIIDQKLSYMCYQCSFRIDPNCAWLPETAVYKGHRHPFQLSHSPRDNSDEYYCDVCEKERDPSYWIYYCAECDYPAHTRCLVPAAWPPPSDS